MLWKNTCWSGARPRILNVPLNIFSPCAQVTDGAYVPVSSMNGAGFRAFDMVIPFTLGKGEITGENPVRFQPSRSIGTPTVFKGVKGLPVLLNRPDNCASI